MTEENAQPVIDGIAIIADPAFVGSFPIRQDITVLPAGDPKTLKIGWVVHERTGWEVYRFPDELYLSPLEIVDSRHWPRDKDKKPLYHHKITSKDDLKFGDKILIKSIYDYLWSPAIYDGNDYAYTDSKKEWGALLQFGHDDRNCWCSVMHGKMGGLDFFTSDKIEPSLQDSMKSDLDSDSLIEAEKDSCFLDVLFTAWLALQYCVCYVLDLADEIIWRVRIDGDWEDVEAPWATLIEEKNEREDCLENRDTKNS